MITADCLTGSPGREGLRVTPISPSSQTGPDFAEGSGRKALSLRREWASRPPCASSHAAKDGAGAGRYRGCHKTGPCCAFGARPTHIIHELKERSCGFISFGDAWCDTTNEMGRFMLTVMSGIAELERDLIRKRCQAGIERAKEKGVKFGRPRAL